MVTERNLTYFLYARKSSESDDRQVQSIDDQVNRLHQLAHELHLTVKQVYTEAKSAKMPYNRPVFTEILHRIEAGEADGILCWQINRLSRNPVDSGWISWLLQRGVLKSIQTIDRQYLPDDNVLLFSVESGTANQFIIDLRKNVKRGTESKINKGWAPNVAPLGYLNDRLEKTIITDPKRFRIVRKVWDLMLTGNYSTAKVLEIATNKYGLRTRKWYKQGYGGNPLSKSGIYRIFTNPFYTGVIYYSGKYYPGKHKPMITMDEFKRVQMLLGRPHNPRPKHKEFAFTGAIRCAECGCMFTAEERTKRLKNGLIKTYSYYRCTRKTKRVTCTQTGALTTKALEELIKKEIEKYTISPEFLEWALEEIKKEKDTEQKTTSDIVNSNQAVLDQIQKELDELVIMRRRQLIDDVTFVKEKSELESSRTKLIVSKPKTSVSSKWLELTQQTFEFATYALNAFLNGEFGLKRSILLGMSKKCCIKQKKLYIEPYEWLIPIKNSYPSLEEEFRRFGLNKTLTNIERNEALTSIRSRWLSTVKEVRKVFEQINDTAIYIPKVSELKNV